MKIDQARVEPLAAALSSERSRIGDTGLMLADRPSVERTAYALCFDAVNFGSGWWPTVRKRPGLSGSRTMMAALEDRFRSDGPWDPAELATIATNEVAASFEQDPAHQLVGLYATALRELGTNAADAGGWLELAVGLGDSAAQAVAGLSRWPGFADTSEHGGHRVPIFKRAQIAVADLNRTGAREDADLARLTLFADNLVPHVLKLDGLLCFDPALDARIDRGELLEHGSEAEVEIRAVAIHAVELLSPASGVSAAELDEVLWHRGRGERYKARPRHRSRTTAY